MKPTHSLIDRPLGRGFSILLFTFFCAVLGTVPILSLFLPNATYSEDENRMLATAPEISAEALFSGEYTHRLSSYLCDHLPMRSTLLKTKAAAEYAALRQENNHVIAARNGYLVKHFEYTDRQLDTFDQNLNAIKALNEVLEPYGKPVTFVCAPRAADVLADFCPPLLEEPETRSVWMRLARSNTDALTVTPLLREKANRGEKVWYRTDHHWTTLGAYYAYTVLGEHLGYTPLPRDAFTEQTVCTDFLGTSYSSCLIPICRADSVTAMRYEGDSNFICTDLYTSIGTYGFYREDALAKKDKYLYFLGANTAHLRITKDPESPRPTLLVIKDSYAQSIAPFLARHFDIELIDLRYFRTDATEVIREIVVSPHYAGTLILCNADTLTGEVGFSLIDTEKL